MQPGHRSDDRSADRDRALFDRIAESICRKDLSPASRKARRMRLDRTLELAGWDGRGSVLEVGCGAGFAAGYLDGRCSSYHGIDHSPRLIEIARELHTRDGVTFDAVAADDFDPDRRFDLLLMIGVLHHLADPAATLARLARYIEPGGAVAVNEPQSGNPLVQALRALRTRFDGAYSADQRFFSARELERLLLDAGLDPVELCPQGFATPPFAEVVLPAQTVLEPVVALAGVADRTLDTLPRRLTGRLSWNLIAIARPRTPVRHEQTDRSVDPYHQKRTL